MNKSRIVSLLIFLIYFGYSISINYPFLSGIPLIGMVFIWFPNLVKISEQMNVSGKIAPMDPNTPSCIFALIGWALMFGPAIIGLIAHLADS